MHGLLIFGKPVCHETEWVIHILCFFIIIVVGGNNDQNNVLMYRKLLSFPDG